MKTQPWNVKLHYNVLYVSWNKNFFNGTEYDKLYPPGSAPAPGSTPAPSQTSFIFSSKFYNQIDGVAKSSPLAHVLDKILMGFPESKCLNEYNLNKPKIYWRYVNDILAAFHNEQDSLNFLNFLNNRHPNIKFTIEKQINHCITFLDVFISVINNQNLTLQTYRKSTYKGLLLNLKSLTSFSIRLV